MRRATKRATVKRATRRNAGTRKKITATVRKGGRKLYGAAAAAVLASRAGRKKKANPRKKTMLDFIGSGKYGKRGTRRYRDLAPRGKGSKAHRRAYGSPLGAGYHWTPQSTKKRKLPNGIFRTAARQAISRRLTKPIRFGRRRNSAAPAGIEQMHEKFLGRPSSGSFEIVAPQGTPKDVAVLGELTKLKTEDEEFVFDKGEAYMGADSKGNLYVLGDVQVEANTNFGEIDEICYLARKDHLQENPQRIRGSRRRKARRNPAQLIEYYHHFGEDGGTLPKLKTDSDGMMHIAGGSYTIEAEGITD